ncbi:MAG: glycoside hydrolase family 97 C-terminal domain-containing protein [Puia sp.]|nr:glycoside hydrolase family 97 C-terminal domain-containing protein [Puia sp.]
MTAWGDWDDTKILAAEPGDYIAIARKEKGKEEIPGFHLCRY